MRIYFRYTLISIILIAFWYCPVKGQSLKEVEGTGRGYPEETAYMEARLNALQKFGVKVYSVFTEFTSGNVNEVDRFRDFFVMARSSGLIYDEDTLSPAKLLPGDQTGQKPLYEVSLRVKIKALSAEDTYFNVSVDIDPPRKVYTDGQRIKLSVTSSKDCYVNIFSISSDNQAYLVFPNFARVDNHLLADKTIVVEELAMTLAEDQNEGNEILLAVATKQQVRFFDFEDPESWKKIAQKDGSYLAVSPYGIANKVIRRLSELGDDQWTSTRYTYTLKR